MRGTSSRGERIKEKCAQFVNVFTAGQPMPIIQPIRPRSDPENGGKENVNDLMGE